MPAMVSHREQAIRPLYVSTAWVVVLVTACLTWFGVWFRFFKDKPAVVPASNFHPMQN